MTIPSQRDGLCDCIDVLLGVVSLFQLLNLDNGLFVRVDGKADIVSRLELIKSDEGSTLYPMVIASIKPGISLWSTTSCLLVGTTAMTLPSPVTDGGSLVADAGRKPLWNSACI